MGKCKKRTLNKPVLAANMSRNDAIEYIVSHVQNNNLDTEAKKLLTLFGITSEELSEAGATYEELVVLKRHM